MIPIAEDFDDIRVRLEMLEREKVKALTAPAAEVQSGFYESSMGYVAKDYDPA